MTDKEKLEKAVKLADGMYYAAQYLTTDASRLRKAMDEYHQFIINVYCKEELASEELDRAAYRYADCTANLDARETRFRGFTAGAEWQKEQMMKDAISGIIFGSRYFRQKNISLTNLSEEQYDKLKDFGERIKVIIIKE